MRSPSLRLLWLGLLAIAVSPRLAAADPALDVIKADAASLATPFVIEAREVKVPRPLWAEGRLLAERPQRPAGLAAVSQAGFPVFDAQTRAWYASADGVLVRVDPDGSLPVLTDNVQGLDLDVRAARGMAVSRERGEQIVLHVWRGGERRTKVLLTGEAFFRPRFSPDGSRVLVAESRAGGGHMWLVDTSSGEAVDLGQGYDAAWHPDGKRVVFVRLEHDGSAVTASTVLLLDLATRGEVELLHRTGAQAPLAPALSPDGKLLAWATAQGHEVRVAPLPAGGR